MGFIENLGAPQDEYSLEAAEMKLKYRSQMSDDEIVNMTFGIFDDLIGVDNPNFREECTQKVSDLRKILDKTII